MLLIPTSIVPAVKAPGISFQSSALISTLSPSSLYQPFFTPIAGTSVSETGGTPNRTTVGSAPRSIGPAAESAAPKKQQHKIATLIAQVDRRKPLNIIASK